MTTLAEYQALVKTGIGGRDSAEDIAMMYAAINYAGTLAALLFEPPELKLSANLTYPGSSEFQTLNGLGNWLNVDKVFNTTDNNEMYFIPYEMLNSIVPPNLTLTKYYGIYGTSISVRKIPAGQKTLTVYFQGYPAKLVNTTDQLAFSQHDSFIVSTAISLCQAFFEEAETVAMWQKLKEEIVLPFTLGRRSREVLAKEQVYFDTLAAAGAQK